MSDITLPLNEHNTLEFDAEIEGIDTKNIQTRLVIESKNMNLSFNGTMKGNTVTIDIPILSSILNPDSYNTKLEFVVEGEKYFAPMEAVIEFVRPVSIKASVRESTHHPVTESTDVKPKITVKKRTSMKDRIIENIDTLATAKSVGELTESYRVLVTKTEGEIDVKEMLSNLDLFCSVEFDKTFKEYVKEGK